MRIQKFQQGGMAPAPMTGGAPMNPAVGPAMGDGQDPIVQILQIAGEALQTGNCEAAMAVCEALLMIAQESSGVGPVGEPQGEPVFKKGGKITKTLKKSTGGKVGAKDFIGKAKNIRKGKGKSVTQKK